MSLNSKEVDPKNRGDKLYTGFYQTALGMENEQKRLLIATNLRQAKLLVVEDSDDQWILVQKAIQACLPKVAFVRAATAEQSIDLLQNWYQQQNEVPKLILLDLYLPERAEGWNLLEQIKGLASIFRQIPVVMLSGSIEAVDIAEAHQRGVSSYLTKPTDYVGWISLFTQIRAYWWETVTLPPAKRSG